MVVVVRKLMARRKKEESELLFGIWKVADDKPLVP